MNLPDWTPNHFVFNHAGPEVYDIDCTACGTGMKSGASFGPISGADMAATFVVQHTVHRGSQPIGLTPLGHTSKALRDYIAAWRRGVNS